MRTDTRTLLTAQGIRALAYGFGAVVLGGSAAASGLSHAQVGVLLTAVVAGMALMSIVVGTVGDRLGRRRVYALLFVGLAVSGLVFALTTQFWALCLVALTGTLSTGVSESGPFTTLEQSMLPVGLDRRAATRVFGRYNAVAAIAGSVGALAAGGPAVLRRVLPSIPGDHRLFLAFVPVGIAGCVLALRLSDRVEAEAPTHPVRLQRPDRNVARLSGLFAVDSLAGSFVLQTFIAYWLQQRFGASLDTLGAVFFATGLLQALSYVLAPRLAERIGLLDTMVLTHLVSNLPLIALAFAPTLAVAVVLLFARFALSQMDVPARQAFIAALVAPDELTAAAASTNAARNVVRPVGPALAGASQQLGLGVPFLIGGLLKCLYDAGVWACFRRVPLRGDTPPPPTPPMTEQIVAGGSVNVAGLALRRTSDEMGDS